MHPRRPRENTQRCGRIAHMHAARTHAPPTSSRACRPASCRQHARKGVVAWHGCRCLPAERVLMTGKWPTAYHATPIVCCMPRCFSWTGPRVTRGHRVTKSHPGHCHPAVTAGGSAASARGAPPPPQTAKHAHSACATTGDGGAALTTMLADRSESSAKLTEPCGYPLKPSSSCRCKKTCLELGAARLLLGLGHSAVDHRRRPTDPRA